MDYYWPTLPQFIPFDIQLCWVRVKYYYGKPFLATWDETNQQFISLLGTIIYPAWSIARWREYSNDTDITFTIETDQTPVNVLAFTMAGWKYFYYSVDWGDGSVTQGYFTGEIESFSHTYASAVNRTVTFRFPSPSMTYLYFNNEPVFGSLPDLSMFKNLTYLSFREGNFTGAVFASLPYPELTTLDLRYNEITGSLPSLDECIALSVLNCRNCQLSGNIPSFSLNTQLTDIRLQVNSFTGSIPNLDNNTLLTVLQLLSNGFTGSIPSLANCPLLDNVNVSSNALTGDIPALTNLTVLTQIVVSNQAISGYTASTLASSLTSFLAQNCALTSAAVNQILADFVTNLAARPLIGTINLSGGTSGAPTGQGIVDKAAIIARGWTVTTN